MHTFSFETRTPVPYMVSDEASGLKLTAGLTCAGEVSWQIGDEKLFRDFCPAGGEEAAGFTDMLKNEVLAALLPALARRSMQAIPYEKLVENSAEIGNEVLQSVTPRWESHGMRPVSFRLTEASVSEKDAEMIRRLQKQAELRDPAKAAEALMKAQQALLAAKGWRCAYCGSFTSGPSCTHCGAPKTE